MKRSVRKRALLPVLALLAIPSTARAQLSEEPGEPSPEPGEELPAANGECLADEELAEEGECLAGEEPAVDDLLPAEGESVEDLLLLGPRELAVVQGASGWVGRVKNSWVDGQIGMALDSSGKPHIVYGEFLRGPGCAGRRLSRLEAGRRVEVRRARAGCRQQ